MKKLIYIFIFTALLLPIYGCSTSKTSSIKKITTTLNELKEYTNTIYIIPDDFFPNTTNKVIKSSYQIVKRYDNDKKTDTPNNNLELDNTIRKCYLLNENTKSIIKYINYKIDDISLLLDYSNKKDFNLSNNTLKSCDIICNKISLNLKRLTLSKEKITKENKIEEKENNINEYKTLFSKLEHRNTHLNNICYYVEELNNNIDNSILNDNDLKPTWSNIDTFKKDIQNKNINKKASLNYPYQNQYNPYYNNFGYNNYGFGRTNPFYGGYYGMNGFGNYPYNYNPYFPNIDTFGSYKNIDTYKPIEIKETNNDYVGYYNNNQTLQDYIYCPFCGKKIENKQTDCINNNKDNKNIKNENIINNNQK